MYRFFHGTGDLPPEYEEIYICQTLGLSYADLERQPVWWVERSMEYLTQKSKYDEAQNKLQAARSKKKR